MDAIVGHDLNINKSTYEILQILKTSLLDKIPINELLKETNCKNINELNYN